ncbi:hypothetical protein HBI29_177040 [Parastagonospora nodorum]|nr:hypothetical protein HBI11_034050 [Parastagonospora nodorum]KAH5496813.1 hypothetical protein HBI29_177040 [Parastagonospora nodorum]KAH6413122.1 hypothetical protein HBI08_127520 [Parastagonospora nodorum]KAH6435420.1 hypothetical protein HBI59_168900 [Parastagonospora nodorum]
MKRKLGVSSKNKLDQKGMVIALYHQHKKALKKYKTRDLAQQRPPRPEPGSRAIIFVVRSTMEKQCARSRADRVMSPLTPSKPNGQYVVKIARSSSSGYVGSPAMFKGGWWMDSHAATLSILQNRFRESVISSLATNHLLAQYNVGHIIPRGSSGVVYLHIVDAIEVYRLGYALLSHSIPRNDPHVDEGAMSKQAAMLADWVAGCYAVTDPRGHEEDFLKELWEPASVEWMAMILRATHSM